MTPMQLLDTLEIEGFNLERRTMEIGGAKLVLVTTAELRDALMSAYKHGYEDGRQDGVGPEASPSNVLYAKRYAKLRDMAAHGVCFGVLFRYNWNLNESFVRTSIHQGEQLDRILDGQV